MFNIYGDKYYYTCNFYIFIKIWWFLLKVLKKNRFSAFLKKWKDFFVRVVVIKKYSDVPWINC